MENSSLFPIHLFRDCWLGATKKRGDDALKDMQGVKGKEMEHLQNGYWGEMTMTTSYVVLSEILMMNIVSCRKYIVKSVDIWGNSQCVTDIALDFSVAHPSADVDVAQTRVQQTFSALPRETAVLPGQDYNCIIQNIVSVTPGDIAATHIQSSRLYSHFPQVMMACLVVISACTTMSLFFFPTRISHKHFYVFHNHGNDVPISTWKQRIALGSSMISHTTILHCCMISMQLYACASLCAQLLHHPKLTSFISCCETFAIWLAHASIRSELAVS